MVNSSLKAGWSVRPSVPASPVGEDNPHTRLERIKCWGENRALGSQPAFHFYPLFDNLVKFSVSPVVFLKNSISHRIGQF